MDAYCITFLVYGHNSWLFFHSAFGRKSVNKIVVIFATVHAYFEQKCVVNAVI